MSEKIQMKYLCEIDTNVKTIEAFKHFLTYNQRIKFSEIADTLEFSQEGMTGQVNYKIIKVEKAKGNYFILNVSSENIDNISNLNRLLNMTVRNVAENKILLLKDGISLHYSSMAYNRLHKMENAVRALLTEVMCFFGNKNWAEKEAKEILNIERKGTNDSNVLYSRNFDQLEQFLFTEYSEYSHEELLHGLLEKDLNEEELVNLLKDVNSKMPKSIWERHFKKVSQEVGIEGGQLQKLLRNVYEFRNHIAHCNTFHKSDYEKFESDCSKIETAIDSMVDLIERNELSASIEQSEIEDSLSFSYLDTIIVPAQRKGFEEVFIGENQWYEIRISDKRIDDIKYIAVYQAAPVSAITHYAEVKEIVDADENVYKKKVIFKEPAQKLLHPVRLGANSNLAPQSPRYIAFEQLENAETLGDLFG